MEVNESDSAGAANLEKVDHVVVVMLENRSFDHMLGVSVPHGQAPGYRRPAPGAGQPVPGAQLPGTPPRGDGPGPGSRPFRGRHRPADRRRGHERLRRQRGGDPGRARGQRRRPGLRHGLLRRHRCAGLRSPGGGVRGLRPLVQLGGRCHAAQPPVRLDRGGRRKPGRPAILLTAPVPPALLRPAPRRPACSAATACACQRSSSRRGSNLAPPHTFCSITPPSSKRSCRASVPRPCDHRSGRKEPGPRWA